MQLNAQFTLSGTVTDSISGEQLLFASVYIPETGHGTISNEYGFFSLEIPKDSTVVIISYLGYQDKRLVVTKENAKSLSFGLAAASNDLDVVEIVVNKKSKLQEVHNNIQMSSIQLPAKDIVKLPSLGGESDILKIVQLMPGVQAGSEGQNGMFVRGGDVDQNLVLLDEAVLYNLGHLFGFFSVFNSDALKDVTLIKGGFPSEYGGRLSSVLDIRMKEGNMKEFHGRGGIGLLSSRLTLEGPIIKDKMSFMVSGRRTYIDQVFKRIGSFLPYYFYDLNGKLNYKISEKDHLYFSAYLGNDVLDLNAAEVDEGGDFNFGFTLGNTSSTIRWNHVFNDKMFANFTGIYTNFDYNITGNFTETSLYISSAIDDIGAKADFDYFLNDEHKFKFGGMATLHTFRPNIVNTTGLIEEVLDDNKGALIRTGEYGLYGGHIYQKDSSNWVFQTGARLTGSIVEGRSFIGLEPRLSAQYIINDFHNIKWSYSNMRQYMHLVTSSTVALPTDLWYPVTKNIRPQISDQVAIGYSHFNRKIKSQFTVESYYKWMNNLTEYREGANLLLNDEFEQELLQGRGRSYGVEFLLKRDEGWFTGWIGYGISWTERQFDELNNGNWYYATYDRRHSISAVTSIKLSEKWNAAFVWVYATGSRFTPQIGYYAVPNTSFTGVDLIPEYAERNSVRMSPAHRLDLNFVYKSRESKKFRSEWHFGAYNFYNRASPWRINVTQNDDGSFSYVQPGLFGMIPSIAYNFEF
jgi:hypothetical protein